MQQSGGLLLAAGWTAATPLFSFLKGMKMQTNLRRITRRESPEDASEKNLRRITRRESPENASERKLRRMLPKGAPADISERNLRRMLPKRISGGCFRKESPEVFQKGNSKKMGGASTLPYLFTSPPTPGRSGSYKGLRKCRPSPAAPHGCHTR